MRRGVVILHLDNGDKAFLFTPPGIFAEELARSFAVDMGRLWLNIVSVSYGEAEGEGEPDQNSLAAMTVAGHG